MLHVVYSVGHPGQRALETTRAIDSILVNGDTEDKAQEASDGAGDGAGEKTSAMMNHPASLIWLLRSLPKVWYLWRGTWGFCLMGNMKGRQTRWRESFADDCFAPVSCLASVPMPYLGVVLDVQ